MATFNYTALDTKGSFVKGAVQGASKKRVRQKLEKEGFVVVNLKQEITRKYSRLNHSVVMVTRMDRIFFTRHLYTMLEAGLALDKALHIAAEQNDNEKFRHIISDLYKWIQQGQPLHAALARHPKYFSNFYINLVKVGEQSGKLNHVLLHLLEQQEKDLELITKARSSLIYPAILIAATFGIVTLMMAFVVPKISEILYSYDVALPFTTRVLIAVSNFLAHYGWFVIPLIILIAPFLFRLWTRHPRGKAQWDNLLLSLPVVGKIVKEFNLARISRANSAILKSGLPINRALELAASVTQNSAYKKTLQSAVKLVLKGIPFSEILKGHPKIYPPIVTRMVEIGEKTGQIDHMFDRLANFYERSVTQKLSNLTVIIEPILLLTVGSTIGFIAVSILLPIWKFAETV